MRQALIAVAAGVLLGGIGCEREPEATTPPETPRSTEAQVQDATRSVTSALQQKSQEMQKTAEEAKATAQDAAEQRTAEAKAAAGTASGGASEQAQKLLDQAMQYAKDNKFDLAEKALAQAEALPNLPADMKARIPQVRQSIAAMKSSGEASKAARDVGNAADAMKNK
jgi:hypothetical protein